MDDLVSLDAEMIRRTATLSGKDCDSLRAL